MEMLLARIATAFRFFFATFLGTKAVVTSPQAMEYTQIYYFPTDADGNEAGTPILVDLDKDGSANLARLPDPLRARLSRGIPDELHTGVIRPQDGKVFLSALLRTTTGYTRFRP